MKYKNKTVSTRVSPEVEAFLSETFKSVSAGLAECASIVMHVYGVRGVTRDIRSDIETLVSIRWTSLVELQGMFTPGEWLYLRDCVGEISSTSRCSADMLRAFIWNADELHGLGKKYGVSVMELVEKVRGLSYPQMDALHWRLEKGRGADAESWAEW